MTKLQPQLDLIQWVEKEGGFFHEDVEVAHDPDKGFYVQVCKGKTVRPGTRIASCPMPATISVLNAMDISPFKSHGTQFPALFISKQSFATVQFFFLMEQYLLGPKSWWAPYIAALPSPDNIDSMHLSDGIEEDTKWIAGTNLKVALVKQNEKWRELHAGASEQLKNLQWPNAVQDRYTWRLFLWAATMFGSRSFTSQVLSDTAPADQARPLGRNHPRHQELAKLFSEGFPVLLPVLDILNYKPKAHVEWQARYSYVGLQVLDQFESGEEVCNNYGPRDNETLIVGYGFAIPSNPFDHYSVGLRVPPNSPLAEIRKWQPEKKDEDYQCYIFNIDHPRTISASCLEVSIFSFDLLDSISVLSATDRELQKMTESKKTYVSERIAAKATNDNRNLLQTFVQLHQECQARFNLLQTTDPALTVGRSSLPPSTQKQRYTHIYRESQTTILQTAVALCKYILVRARTGGSVENVVEATRMAYGLEEQDERTISELGKLVNRHTGLIQWAELMDCSDITKMMPTEASVAFNNIITSLQNGDTGLMPASELARCQLAVLLAYQMFSNARHNLKPRISTWIKKLKAWYPPDDPNWCSVLGERDSPEIEALLRKITYSIQRMVTGESLQGNVSNMQEWYAIGRLCWAWNVVEEESVRIPGGVLQLRDAAQDGDVEDTEIFLYIPSI